MQDKAHSSDDENTQLPVREESTKSDPTMDEMLETLGKNFDPDKDTSVKSKTSQDMRSLLKEVDDIVEIISAQLPDKDIFAREEDYAEDDLQYVLGQAVEAGKAGIVNSASVHPSEVPESLPVVKDVLATKAPERNPVTSDLHDPMTLPNGEILDIEPIIDKRKERLLDDAECLSSFAALPQNPACPMTKGEILGAALNQMKNSDFTKFPSMPDEISPNVELFEPEQLGDLVNLSLLEAWFPGKYNYHDCVANEK